MRPAHRAVCADCLMGVTFRSTASGAGFTVLGHSGTDPELTFGISEVGLPMCPNGHGEMQIADEEPVEDAFAHVAEQIQAATPVGLPFPNPFNADGALESIFAKNHEFQDCEKRYTDLKGRTKDAKEEMDECAKKLKALILDYEKLSDDRAREIERRQAAIERGEDPDAEVVVCRFALLHPGVPCPFDHAGLSTDHLTSEAHAVEAHDLLVKSEIADCVTELAVMGVMVTAEILGALPIEDLSTVQAWAKDGWHNPDRQAELLTALPKGLGRPHVAGEVGTNSDQTKGYQECSACGMSFECETPYPVGTLVDINCEGTAKEVGHRYPKAKGKKNTRKVKG